VASATTNRADLVGGGTIDGLVAFSTTIDGLAKYTFDSPILSAAMSPGVGLSSAVISGADAAASQVNLLIAGTSVSLNGADTTAASTSVVAALSSSGLDGADGQAGTVSVTVSPSSAVADGADTLASSVSPLVVPLSATTDGSDTINAVLAVVVGLSSAVTNGADILAAEVSPIPAFTVVNSATTDGADGVQAQIDLASSSAAATNEVILRKWYVRRDNKLHVFSSASDADAFIEADDKADAAIAQAQKTSRLARKRLRNKVVGVALPESTVQIDYLAQLVSRYAIPVDLPALIAQQDWQRVMQIMAIALQAQEDDDIEMLLLV
ncbi:MAG: hypothetical protein HQ446_00635, partial [Polaromonas sp.]|nr:hypothetical protein [Polaromonas sp.]